MPCGRRLALSACKCVDVCSCPVEPILCDCETCQDDHEAVMLAVERFCAEADPDNYDEPVRPRSPTRIVTRSLRVELMRVRVSMGERPFHPRDLDPRRLKVQVVVTRTPNGKLAGAVLAPIAPKEDKDPWEWDWDDDETCELEDVMDGDDVPIEEMLEYRLFYPNGLPVDFYALPASRQQKSIREAEDQFRHWLETKRKQMRVLRMAINAITAKNPAQAMRYHQEAEKFERDLAALERMARKDA